MITYLDPDDPNDRELSRRDLVARMYNARFPMWLARRKREELWWNISAGVFGLLMLPLYVAMFCGWVR